MSRKSRTPEYIAWMSMNNRVKSPTSKDFRHYGGRGITIDYEWRKFDTFLADMGASPSPKHTLDRIDNDGPYSKENCRWRAAIQHTENEI